MKAHLWANVAGAATLQFISRAVPSPEIPWNCKWLAQVAQATHNEVSMY